MEKDYGPLAFDIPHRFVASFIYELPFGAGRRFAHRAASARAILGGWSVNGILTLSDGRPFTVTANDQANTGQGRITRANCVGDAVPDGFDQTLDAWFDATAFAATAARTYGNCGNNTVRGPGSKSMNMCLFRIDRRWAATSASSCASRPSTCSTGSTTASRPPTSRTPAPSAASPARSATRGRCSWRSSSTSSGLGARDQGLGTDRDSRLAARAGQQLSRLSRCHAVTTEGWSSLDASCLVAIAGLLRSLAVHGRRRAQAIPCRTPARPAPGRRS